MAAATQLSAALAGLAIANRTGKLNLIAGALLLGFYVWLIRQGDAQPA